MPATSARHKSHAKNVGSDFTVGFINNFFFFGLFVFFSSPPPPTPPVRSSRHRRATTAGVFDIRPARVSVAAGLRTEAINLTTPLVWCTHNGQK